jgi:UDP-2,3-diacylglucosamine hydrolase
MSKTYFASDFHLGTDALLSSIERERMIVKWMDSIADDAGQIFLVGDVFDYWFEYKKVIPKSYSRLFGKIAELKDSGIPIFYFTGNHDMWMFKYMEEEFGIPILREPVTRIIAEKKFFIGHGDGLGPGDQGYKLIKSVFSNPVCQHMYSWLHPDIGIPMMRFFSGTSRKSNPSATDFYGTDQEWLVQFCENQLEKEEVDYFVFGHRNLPINFTLKNGRSRYINLGDWLVHQSYATFDGNNLELQFFENEKGKVFGNRQ